MNLFVARLSYSTTNDELQSAFEQYGQVDSARIIMDRETGKSKGFGFVEMPDDGQAQEAIEGLNESELDGRNIVVKVAEDRGDRGGGGGRRFDRNDGYNRGGGGGGYNRERRY